MEKAVTLDVPLPVNLSVGKKITKAKETEELQKERLGVLYNHVEWIEKVVVQEAKQWLKTIARAILKKMDDENPKNKSIDSPNQSIWKRTDWWTDDIDVFK